MALRLNDFIQNGVHNGADLSDLSMEALAFQTDGYFDTLTALFNTVRTASGKRLTETKAIEKSIMDRIGIRVKFTLLNDPTPNAYIWIPKVDSSHPLYSRSAASLSDVDIVKQFKAGILKNKGLVGTLNTKTASVSGIYSEIPFHIVITTGMMDDSTFTDAEMAGVFCHEVGHAYSALYVMGYSYRQNYALSMAQRAITETLDTITVNDVLIATAKSAPTLKEQLTEITQEKSVVIQQQLLLGVHQRAILSYQDAPLYDQRSAEHFSDFFVARFGGSLPLASALDKLLSKWGVDLKESTTDYYISTLVGFLAGVVLLPLTVLFMTIMVSTDSMNPRHTYDSTRNRIAAIKRQSVERIKFLKADGAEDDLIAAAVEEYKAIEAIEGKYRDYRYFYEWLSDTVLNSKQVKISDMQRQLERLNANPIFIRAAELGATS